MTVVVMMVEAMYMDVLTQMHVIMTQRQQLMKVASMLKIIIIVMENV